MSLWIIQHDGWKELKYSPVFDMFLSYLFVVQIHFLAVVLPTYLFHVVQLFLQVYQQDVLVHLKSETVKCEISNSNA